MQSNPDYTTTVSLISATTYLYSTCAIIERLRVPFTNPDLDFAFKNTTHYQLHFSVIHFQLMLALMVVCLACASQCPGKTDNGLNFPFQEAPAFTVIQAQSSARLSRSTHGGLGGGGGGGRYGSRSRLDGGSMGGGGGSRHGSQVDLSRSVQMTGEEDYIQPYEPQPQRAPRVNSQTYRSYENNLLF